MLGRRLGEALSGGSCVALVGELGAGKTAMVKGIAAGAGVSNDVSVNSPTFVIVNEYPGRVYIFHVDAYRMTSAEEFAAIGVGEMLTAHSAVLIEWADRVPSMLPADRLTILLEHAGPTDRRIFIGEGGPHSRRLLESVFHELRLS